MSYAPVPPRTWHDAHAVFMFAHQRSLQQTPIGSDNPEATPERLYVHAPRWWRSPNPTLRLPSRPVGPGRAVSAGAFALGAAHRRRLRCTAFAKAVAVVPWDTTSRLSRPTRAVMPRGNKLYLLTYDLASRDPGAVARARGGRPASGKRGQGSGRQRRKYIALLRRLLRQWAIPPARQFNRLASRARVVMRAGFAGAWQYSRGTHVPRLRTMPVGLADDERVSGRQSHSGRIRAAPRSMPGMRRCALATSSRCASRPERPSGRDGALVLEHAARHRPGVRLRAALPTTRKPRRLRPGRSCRRAAAAGGRSARGRRELRRRWCCCPPRAGARAGAFRPDAASRRKPRC